MQNMGIQRADWIHCTLTLYIRDFSIPRFWYLLGLLAPISYGYRGTSVVKTFPSIWSFISSVKKHIQHICVHLCVCVCVCLMQYLWRDDKGDTDILSFPCLLDLLFCSPYCMSAGLWFFHKNGLMADNTLWDQLQNVTSFAQACMPDSNIRAILRVGGREGWQWIMSCLSGKG